MEKHNRERKGGQSETMKERRKKGSGQGDLKKNKTFASSSSSSSSIRRREVVELCAHESADRLSIDFSFSGLRCFLLAAFSRITHLFELLEQLHRPHDSIRVLVG